MSNDCGKDPFFILETRNSPQSTAVISCGQG
jgi:hypothetical protein